MSHNMLIGQSGGPTVAINSSLAGAFMESVRSSEIEKIYGAHNGIEGLLKKGIIDLNILLKMRLKASE